MKRSAIVVFFIVVFCILHFSPFSFWRNFVIGLFSLFTILDKRILGKVKMLFLKPIFWISLIPFIIYAVSIIHSDSMQNGLKQIEFKLSLLVLPLFIGLTQLDRKSFRIIAIVCVTLITILPIIGFFIQYQVVQETGDSGWLYNDNLVSFIDKQAVYYGLFINTAILLLMHLKQAHVLKKRTHQLIAIVSLIILITAQYLLASRVSILLTGLLMSSYIGFLVLKKLNTKQSVLLVLGFCSTVFILFSLFPKVAGRFNSITNVEYRYDNPNPINHYNGQLKKENWNGLNTRLAIWNCAWEEVLSAPMFGYGLGNVQQQLVKNYKEKNFILGLNSNYNTHNQYLDILLMSGFAGFFFFIIFIVWVLLYAIKQRNFLLVGFTLIFCISCLTENILNRDQGVVFIALMFSLLFGEKKVNHAS